MNRELSPVTIGAVVVALLVGILIWFNRATSTQYTKEAPPGIPAEVQQEFQRRAGRIPGSGQ